MPSSSGSSSSTRTTTWPINSATGLNHNHTERGYSAPEANPDAPGPHSTSYTSSGSHSSHAEPLQHKSADNPYFRDSQLYQSPAQTASLRSDPYASALSSGHSSTHPFHSGQSGSGPSYEIRPTGLPASSQRSTHRDDDDEDRSDPDAMGQDASQTQEMRLARGKGKERFSAEFSPGQDSDVGVDKVLGVGFGSKGPQDGETVTRLLDSELMMGGLHGKWERTGRECTHLIGIFLCQVVPPKVIDGI